VKPSGRGREEGGERLSCRRSYWRENCNIRKIMKSIAPLGAVFAKRISNKMSRRN